MKHICRLLFLITIALSLSSCDDRLFREYSDIGDGESKISATVNFIPQAQTLGSRATAGDAIEDITSLSVVVYDQYQNFYKFFPNVKFTASTNNDRPQLSTEDVKYKAEFSDRSHASATFTLPEVLPYGRYYIYCVANMPNITEDQVQTIEDLRSIRVDWLADVAQNNQMFGFFTAEDKKSSADSYSGFNAPPVVVNKTNLSIHAWINRLASKVTVQFDGSGLNQDVYVYIRKVTIKDIPVSCTLGYDNTPTTTDSLTNGESIYYGPVDMPVEGTGIVDTDPGDVDFEKWMVVVNNGVVRGSNAYDAPSLFFYENMQGDRSKWPNPEYYNKEPKLSDVEKFISDLGKNPADGSIQPENYDTKDHVEYGTYIEVEGYYLSQNPENTGNGNIKYRFMLGKNTTYNFNAQRNHHYKLTLKFNGWANQPEWHIDYMEENPGLYVPDRFYMPYLYNQKADFPVKLNGKCNKLKIEILENSWGPKYRDSVNIAPPGTVATLNPPRNELLAKSKYYNFIWYRDAWVKFHGTTHQFLGFLALTVPSDNLSANILLDVDYSEGQTGFDKLDAYYRATEVNGQKYGSANDKNYIPQNIREFTDFSRLGNINTKNCDGISLDEYTVHRLDENSCDLTVPFFTRPKIMIKNSDFTGNNPYRHFIRYAKVRVTAEFETSAGIVEDEAYVDVIQMPRVTNPKAVWRRPGNKEPFKFILTRGVGPGGNDNFEAVASDGSWTAEVDSLGNYPNFSISTVPEGRYISATKTRIEGRTGSYITFQVNFEGNENSCGIITVRYHGLTCVHKLFVRQGYEPIALTDKGALWTSYNLLAAHDPKAKFNDSHILTNTTGMSSGNDIVEGEFVVSPLAIGSLFKKGNYDQGILDDNDVKYPPLIDGPYKFAITNMKDSLSWGDIRSMNNDDAEGKYGGSDDFSWQWARFQINGKNYRVPDYGDFREITDNCDYGFGILYADGAKTTELDYYAAEGFEDPENDNTSDSRGVRGCVVYNPNNAKQIFFPIGASGNGRRSCFNLTNKDTNVASTPGVLRYGDVSYLLKADYNSNNIYRPIVYNLAHLPGAVYWIRKAMKKDEIDKNYGIANADPCGGWDLNFFTVHFNAYTDNGWRDALPIRLIVDN